MSPQEADEATFHELDAVGQANLVATGQVSALELVDAAIARIERLNPTINAVIWNQFDKARELAKDPAPTNARFGGVPFLLKDIGANQAGLPYWLGNQALKAMDHRADADTILGSRFRQAGLITMGKTNLPEFGSSPTTQPLSCGPTNNPWDLARSPSGSSGGSAAAVASGMVAMAHANDGGGSTRLPAAWCGLVGLKTTRGRVPNPDSVSRLTSELVVSKSVRDTACLLDAVKGAIDADLFCIASDPEPYETSMQQAPGQLKVGLLTDAGSWEIDEGCRIGAEAGASMLEALGHAVTPVESNVLLGSESAVNGELWMAGIAHRVKVLNDLAGRELSENEVDPYNWTAALRGATMSAVDLVGAQERQHQWARSVIEWMGQFDLLVTPTSGALPMLTESLWPPDDKPWRIGKVYGKIGVFTLPFNVTGQPAISLPLHWTDDGLPVGVQLVAGMGREDLLLSVAAQLEAAHPWYHRYRAIS